MVLALLFGSLVCCGMLAVRMAIGHSGRFMYLIWNLFLAWIPLILSFVIRRVRVPEGTQRGRVWWATVLWILFFPNSLYIVTDLIHMKKFGTDGLPQWFDMMVTAAFACAGLFLGCLSLYLIHLSVRERAGYRVGWVFAVVMLALGSFGIYLGRFLRLNSWDVFTQPAKILGKTATLLDKPSEVAAFSVTFFFFSLMAYWFLVAVARMHEDEV